MALIDTLSTLVTLTPVGAAVVGGLIVLTVLSLLVAALILERRFSGRTRAQRRDLIKMARALRRSNPGQD